MSKYIIDLRPDCKVVQQICASNENVNVGARSIGLLDELTDEYVKENFKDLLEGEYQRGLEDGKKEAESSEAIERAKADAFNNGMLHKGEKIHEAYQRGLNDAWECARKIVCDDSCGGMSMKELVEIFNKSSDAYILRDFTAQQAIEMLKAHKQKKDDNIEVGDEICNIDTDRNDTGIVTWRVHDDIYVMWTDGSAGRRNIKDYRKTGRHFDIEKILEAMKA